MTGAVPGIRLNNGVDIPQVGFGVFRLPDDTATERVVLTVIECGYGSIDTAALYGNEVGVGRAVETCGLTRDELFVTTRLAVGPPLQLGGRLRPAGHPAASSWPQRGPTEWCTGSMLVDYSGACGGPRGGELAG